MPVFSLSLDANGVRRGAREAESSLSKLSGKITDTTKSALDLGNVLGGIGVGLSLSKAIQDFAAFQSAVDNIGKVTDDSLAKVTANIKMLDASLGSSTQLAQGYYQVMSAGITDNIKAQEMLVVASKVAKTAGIAQAQAIDALAKAMNGYQGELKSAEQTANMFFATEKLGMTNVAELAPVMGDLSGMAKTLSVSHHELAASMAIVTQTSGSTATAATRINALFVELSRPTDNLTKLYKEMGVASGEALVKAKGLPDALKAIQEAAEKTGQSMSTVFGSQEGYQAFIKLMEDNFGKLKQYSAEVENTSDAMSNAWGRHTQSVNGQFDEVTNRVTNLSTTIGESFGGATLAGLQGLNSGLGFLSENFETVKTGALTLGAGIVALTAVKKVSNSATLASITSLKNFETRVLSLNGANTELAESEGRRRDATLQGARADLEREKATRSALRADLASARQTERMFVGQNNHARALQRVTELQDRYRQSSTNVVTAQTNVRRATEALNRPLLTVGQMAGSAGKSLLGAFGGPAGIAVMALGGGIAYLASQESLAEKAARNHADALKVVTSGANEAADAMQAYLDKLREKSNFELTATIANAKEGYVSFVNELRSLTFDVTPWGDIFSGNTQVRDEVGKIVRAYDLAMDKSSTAAKQLRDDLEGVGEKFPQVSGEIQKFIQEHLQGYEAIALSGETATEQQATYNRMVEALNPTPIFTMASSVETMNSTLANSVWWMDSAHKAFDKLDGLTANLDINFSYNGQATIPEFAPKVSTSTLK